MTKIAVYGAAGRMGRRLIDLIHHDADCSLVGAIESADHPKVGVDAGVMAGIGKIGVNVSSECVIKPDTLIDFSKPAGADQAIAFCESSNTPLVMATTGLSDATQQRIREAARQTSIVWAPSMSLAVNLTMKLVEQASKALNQHESGVDVEIIEHHHRFKADAPSGTALKFGEIIANQMGQDQHCHGREGMIGERPRTEIGYHAIRAGDNPGQHIIHFGMLGESLELKVSASNRDCYALGAIAAAKFAVNQGPGLYSMFDVLGL
jgi:4-hydroxy-tetrahydrodipicolinate reductase